MGNEGGFDLCKERYCKLAGVCAAHEKSGLKQWQAGLPKHWQWEVLVTNELRRLCEQVLAE